MPIFTQITAFLLKHIVTVQLALLALLLLALFLFLVASIRLKRVSDRYNRLMRGVRGENLEALIEHYIALTQELSTQQKKNTAALTDLAAVSSLALQQVALVRYNAFPNTGGDQSFSLALLDQQGNGVVLTNLYGREESYTYAKPIRGYAPTTYPLSAEEEQAVAQAKLNASAQKPGEAGLRLDREG